MSPSGEPERGQQDVDQLDPHEGDDDAAEAVDEEVSPQDGRRAERPVADAVEGERDEGDDDERIEDDRREDGLLRRRQAHDVESRERPGEPTS